MSQPFPAVLGGRWSALEGGYQSNDSNGLRLPSPTAYGNLAAWYDVSDYSSLVVDGSNRVSLIADKSGNSATNCLCLNGSANNGASSPDSAALDITGDLDLRADINPTSVARLEMLIAKRDAAAAANTSYGLFKNLAGNLQFLWSSGAAVTVVTSTVTLASAGLSALSRFQARVTFDVDNGASGNTVQFWYRTDGNLSSHTGWTQLGANVVTAGVASIANTTASVFVGAQYTGSASDNFSGIIYRAQIYNGIGGTLVFDANFATASKLATSFTESSSNAATVTINSSGDLGARISGERDLVQLTASKQPIYLPWSGTNYGWLNGVSGNYFSTPDSAALDITGDIDLRWYGAMDDWTPATPQGLIAKDNVATQRSYYFRINTGGDLILGWSTTGAAGGIITATSTAKPAFADRAIGGVRATLDVDNGAGGYTVTFFTSTDGSTWSQLGNTVTGVGTTSIFAGTAILEVGSVGTGTLERMSGTTIRAQVLNGINGTVVADFDPSRYTSGTTFTASTGETWTLNGGATIVNRTSVYFDGSDDYMKAAAFSLSQPETVYFTGQQVSWTSDDRLYDGGATNSMLLDQGTAPSPTLRIFAGGGGPTSAALALGTTGIVAGVFNGLSSTLRINRGTTATANAGTATPNGFTLGSSGAGANCANQRTNEVAIYSAAHDTSVQDRVIQYAGRKWGVSGV